MHVLLVRPWRDGDVGGGCCGGHVRDGVCLEPDTARTATGGALRAPSAEARRLGELYLTLRCELPEADVQITDARNTAYLLPTVYRAARRQGTGVAAALGRAVRSTAAGAVLVDGERVADVATADADELTSRLRARLQPSPVPSAPRRGGSAAAGDVAPYAGSR